MSPEEILARMNEASTPTPPMSSIGSVYAFLVSSVSDRLAPGELDSFVALGVAIQRQESPRIPLVRDE